MRDVMLSYTTRSNWLLVVRVFIGLLLFIPLTNCNVVATSIPTSTTIHSLVVPTSQQEPVRPEPQEPHIFVSFTGLDDSNLVRIYFRTLSGETPLTGSHPGNGELRVVLPDRQGIIYGVTAEAKGYVSDPISYTIQLNGEIFYIVENGQVTSNEPSVLKFQFTPIFTPTVD